MTPFGDHYRGRRVLVTGHTGFKGSWLSLWLLRLGAEVCGYANGVVTAPALFEDAGLAGEMRHETGDIRDAARLGTLLAEFRPDVVFHLAAQAIVSTSFREPLETMGVNVLGTATVLDRLRTVDWPCAAVMITSDKVYDNVEWAWGYRENDRLGGQDIYSGSKGGAELAIHSYLRTFFRDGAGPVRLATARAGNVIGGGDWAADRIVADCVRAWLDGLPVAIRSPRATRPWQHVLEPLSGYLLLGTRLGRDEALHGEAYNFGPRAEQNATVVAMLSRLAEIWGFADPARAWEATGNLQFKESSLLKLNIDKALIELGWEPNLSYDESVGMTGAWYRDVLKDGAAARARSVAQIDDYVALGAERGRCWAR